MLPPKRKIKILIHQPRLSYYMGGGETVPLEQVRILTYLGHQVEILTSLGPKKSLLFHDFCKKNPQIKIHYLRLPKKEQRIYKEEPGKRWFRWDIESILFGQQSAKFYFSNKNHWDLIITHLLSDSLFIPRNFTNILHLHGVPQEKRDLDNILLKRPDAFIAVAKFVKRGWEKLYPQLKKKNVKVCYNGISTQKFPNLGIKRDIDLLFVGRLLKNKGINTILRATHLLINGGINFNQLIIVGKGPEEKTVKEQIKKLHLAKKVGLVGTVSQNQLINLYNRSKIFLCPSTAKEGILTTMLEAASCGASIITADCCGMTEFAKHNINAFLIKPFDNISLADKIKSLLKDENLRQRLTNEAEKMVCNHWDISKTGKKLEEIYLNFAKNKL